MTEGLCVIQWAVRGGRGGSGGRGGGVWCCGRIDGMVGGGKGFRHGESIWVCRGTEEDQGEVC